MLTTLTYALGGRMETVDDDGKVTATLNNPQTKSSAAACSRRCAGTTTRWARTSTTAGATSTRRSPPARSACTPAAPTSTPTWSRRTSINPDIYGVTTIPLGRTTRTPASSAAAPSPPSRPTPTTRPARRGGRMDRLLLHAEAARPGRSAVRTPRRSRPTTSRSACPPCRSSTRRSTTSRRRWIKDYINVPTAQMTPFTRQIFDQHAGHRADRRHPGALRRPRPRRAGGPDRQERRHRRAARRSQQPGPGPVGDRSTASSADRRPSGFGAGHPTTGRAPSCERSASSRASARHGVGRSRYARPT